MKTPFCASRAVCPHLRCTALSVAWRLACRVAQISGMLFSLLAAHIGPLSAMPYMLLCKLVLSLVTLLQTHLPFPDDLACPDALRPVVWLPLAHGAGVRYHCIPPSWNR